MQYASTFGYRGLAARRRITHLARNGVAHDGEVATRLGLAGIPVARRDGRAGDDPALARDTGVRVHMCRLSSAEGVGIVRAAKKRRLAASRATSRCTTRTCATSTSAGSTPNCAADAAVAQRRATATRLRAGARRRHDRCVCSDHAPVDEDGKQVPFGEAEPGATGLELLLPLTLKWASEEGVPLADGACEASPASRRA